METPIVTDTGPYPPESSARISPFAKTRPMACANERHGRVTEQGFVSSPCAAETKTRCCALAAPAMAQRTRIARQTYRITPPLHLEARRYHSGCRDVDAKRRRASPRLVIEPKA